jgi:hypothetical protein
MISPVGLIRIDKEQSGFSFFLREEKTNEWTGAEFAVRYPHIFIEKDGLPFDFSSQPEPGYWENYQKEVLEQSAEHYLEISRLREKGNRLTQLLHGGREDADRLIPSLQPEVRFDRRSKQYICHVHMHTKGMEELLGYGSQLRAENDQTVQTIGNEYGFGSRVLFRAVDEIAGPDGSKTIRGSLRMREYDEMDRSIYEEYDVLPSVDIIGTPSKRGMSWLLAMNDKDSGKILGVMQGMIRGLRPRKFE